ncbi:MAG: adenosylcobinamide-GDP ribazoletransferase [Bacillota bacterium]|nr:adenosylcobinamide-GDP ribazoletransferase [Bacillota bacterium]
MAGIALGFLTRLPVRLKRPPTEEEFGASVALFPLAGLLVGLVSAGAGLAGRYLVEPNWPAQNGTAAAAGAILYIVANSAITGGLHLDGLSDVADGLACKDPARALDVMKDSHTGVMGVVWLVSDVLARFAFAQALTAPAQVAWLVAAPVVGRAAMAIVISRYPYARGTGTGKVFAQNTRAMHSLVAALLALGACLYLGTTGVLAAASSVFIAGVWAGALARRLGGLTGDTYGSVNEVCELTFLFGALILR